jgi:hypothetical protein
MFSCFCYDFHGTLHNYIIGFVLIESPQKFNKIFIEIFTNTLKSFLEWRGSGREADPSPSSGAEVKKMQIYVYIHSPPYDFMLFGA